MNETIMQGFQATGIGMGGVFLVLILFYILTKLMMAIFGNFSQKDE
jgi:Na+-transporting methylmalonyl-CoA/oxaloacetate decarboxylase gamma subunit